MTALGAAVRRRTIASQLFGPLEVGADQIITFPEGILGFGAQQHYVLLPASEDGLYWMQSCDEARLVFLLVDPEARVPGYVDHVRGVCGEAGAGREGMAVLCIATLPRQRGIASTCNLLGPILIDLAKQEGWQHVLAHGEFSARHPLDLTPHQRRDSSSAVAVR